uniref:Uncharacterized protein n=1 Tax=Clytia hemisphaerica TaxID=252671 RepID=A0A7M5V768_9CNID
ESDKAHVHCPCSICRNKAVNPATEIRNRKEFEELFGESNRNELQQVQESEASMQSVPGHCSSNVSNSINQSGNFIDEQQDQDVTESSDSLLRGEHDDDDTDDDSDNVADTTDQSHDESAEENRDGNI